MPNVALRGVPEPVHRRLKDAARANHRSMNGEILARLAASVSAEPATPSATPEEIREEARGQGVATNAAGAAPRSVGAPMPVVAIPYEPLSDEELRERARKRRAEIDARGGIDLSPETIEALIQEGRHR